MASKAAEAGKAAGVLWLSGVSFGFEWVDGMGWDGKGDDSAGRQGGTYGVRERTW